METQKVKGMKKDKSKTLGWNRLNYLDPKNCNTTVLGDFLFLFYKIMENILKDISELHARNKRVEAEKAWETSWQRKGLIVAITYLFMVFFMNLIRVENIFVNALVPTF